MMVYDNSKSFRKEDKIVSSYAKTFSEYKGDQITYNHIKVERPLEYDLPVHTHDVCEMLLIKSGNVSGIINAKSYELTKNCLIIFRARFGEIGEP